MSRIFIASVLFLSFFVPHQNAVAESLLVHITGIQNSNGFLYVTLWNNEANFLKDVKMSLSRKVLPASPKEMTVRFNDLSAGQYAVSSFHDINGDGVLNRNFFGMPNEPIGISNDAKGVMGPPKFKDASFRIKSDLTQISIKMH